MIKRLRNHFELRRSHRVLAWSFAFVLLAIGVPTTNASLVAKDVSPAGTVGSGSVILTDNNSASESFLNYSTLKPGDRVDRCVTVTNAGTLPSRVSWYFTGLGGTASGTRISLWGGTLSGHRFGSCTGFTPETTVVLGAQPIGLFFTGLPSALPTTYGAGVQRTFAAGESYSYRVTVSTDRSFTATNATLTATWEARNT